MTDTSPKNSEASRTADGTAIASVEASMFQLPLKGSYNMAGRDSGGRPYAGIMVRLRTKDGVEGIGETFVTPGWYAPDTPAGSLFLINRPFAKAVVGESVFDTEAIVNKLDARWMGNLFAKATLEMAVYDAAAKTIGRPLCDLLGGRVRDRFPLVGGVGTETPETMAEAATRYVERGFKTIKLKIGEPETPQMDIDRVRVVREAVGPEAYV